MFKNQSEEKLMKSLLNFFEKYRNKNIIIRWNDGTEIKAQIDTFYETDNGLELDDKDFEEYYGCAIIITEVINLPNYIKNSIHYPEKGEIKNGAYVEISYHNTPEIISSNDGEIIWRLR